MREARNNFEDLQAKKPESLSDVPRYVREVFSMTFTRLIYIFSLVWEAKPSLLIAMVFKSVYDGIMPLVGTLISANLLAKIVESFSSEVDLIFPLALQFGYIFVNSLISSIYSIVNNLSGEIVTNHIKNKIMRKAKEVDLASFDNPDFYERLENANREAGSRPIRIIEQLFSLISRIISMVSYIAVLYTIIKLMDKSIYLFMLIFVGLSILSSVVSFYFRRMNFFYLRRNSKERRQLTYYSDLLVNKDVVKEIKLFSLADLFIGRYQEVFHKYYGGIKNIVLKEGRANILISLLTAILNAFLFYKIATNVHQIADYSIYTSALNAISTCVSAIITSSASIYEGSLFIDNLRLFMNEKMGIVPKTDNPVIPEKGIKHTIELRNVSFSYPGSTRKVIKNVNLTFEAGKMSVLVGLNGAGKTTLIKLITRLYDPTEGEILLDGININQYDVKELYSLYGIIFQDFGKYASTVRENIAYGRINEPIDQERIERAAEKVDATEFISQLKEGYDTSLTRYFETNGTELSIGQWQKLSVARAFYSDADILILDEPTASLDPMAEQEIFNQFEELGNNKTTIFVSHRLSSATIADQIVVLKDGEVVELGNHQQLMDKEGEYYQLFTTQAKRYLDEEDEQSLEPAFN
ncbi:MAG: ABC transporter ATP-binding protein [Erysipelotrichaceae bacterium]|nr:ABC transporter ATP-binding protein [Erysipelotrichaceae bacterium]